MIGKKVLPDKKIIVEPRLQEGDQNCPGRRGNLEKSGLPGEGLRVRRAGHGPAPGRHWLRRRGHPPPGGYWVRFNEDQAKSGVHWQRLERVSFLGCPKRREVYQVAAAGGRRGRFISPAVWGARSGPFGSWHRGPARYPAVALPGRRRRPPGRSGRGPRN